MACVIAFEVLYTNCEFTTFMSSMLIPTKMACNAAKMTLFSLRALPIIFEY